MKEKLPSITVIEVESSLEALQAVAVRKADALAGDLGVLGYLIRKHALTNLKIAAPSGLPLGKLHFAVRSDWPELIGMVQKALSAITEKERIQISKNWISIGDETEIKDNSLTDPGSSKIKLTRKENNWLNANPEIRIAVDPNWQPLEWINPETGKHEGIIADYLKLITERSGLKFKLVSAQTWTQAMENVKSHRADAFSGVKKTTDRQKYLIFSIPYMQLKDAIIMRKDHKAIQGLPDLKGKKVGVVKLYWTEDVLRKDYPELDVIAVKNTLDGLNLVAAGKLDAFVDDPLVTGYLINQHSLYSLKYATIDLDQNKNLKRGLHIAVRKDVPPEVLSIINKAIATFDSKDHNQILGRWGVVNQEKTQVIRLKNPGSPSLEQESLEVVTRKIIIQGLLFILIVLSFMGILYFLIQRYFSSFFSIWLESNKVTWIAPVLMGVFLIMISIIASVALEKIEQQTRNSAARSLQGLVNSTYVSLSVWMEHHKGSIQRLANDPNLLTLTQKHLKVTRTKESLLKSPALKGIRKYFDSNRNLHEDIGFFIISPDYINIGSMRDTNIGFTNLIAQQRPDFIKRAFNGETTFVPPLRSDVALGTRPDDSKTMPPTMFFITPIKDELGKVIAVMTLRLNPTQEFTRLIHTGKFNTSGETYAFDKEGVVISNNRFEDQLKKIGLLNPGSSAILNLRLADPGGNLLEGYKATAPNEQGPLTLMAKSAISGKSGLNIKGYRDYRGVNVLGAWIWDKNLGFGLATEINEQEALAPFYTTRIIFATVLGITFILMILLTAISMWLGKRANRILIDSRNELEERVVERTKELTHEMGERKKSQNALQKNEKKFRNLVEGFKESYFFFSQDTTGVIHYITPSATKSSTCAGGIKQPA